MPILTVVLSFSNSFFPEKVSHKPKIMPRSPTKEYGKSINIEVGIVKCSTTVIAMSVKVKVGV